MAVRATPARGPPVICLLDSSSEEDEWVEDRASAPVPAAAASGSLSDDECTVTAVVTAADREEEAKRAAVLLDGSASPQPSQSPVASGGDAQGSQNTQPASNDADVWARLGGTPVKSEICSSPGLGSDDEYASTRDESESELSDTDIYGLSERDDPVKPDVSSDEEAEEDLYGPDPSRSAPDERAAALAPAPVTDEIRKHADAVDGWAEEDVEEFVKAVGPSQGASLREELRRRKHSGSASALEHQPSTDARHAAIRSVSTDSSSDDEDADPYAAASPPHEPELSQPSPTSACKEEGDFDVGADSLFDDDEPLPQPEPEPELEPEPKQAEAEEEDEEMSPLVARRGHRNRVVLEDSDEDDQGTNGSQAAAAEASCTRSPPRSYDLLDEQDDEEANGLDDDVDLSASSEDEAGELAKELEDLQLYTTSISTPAPKAPQMMGVASTARRSARLSSRKQQGRDQQAVRETRRLFPGAGGAGDEYDSDEEPWNRAEADSADENSLDDFIVDSEDGEEEDEGELSGELGQLLKKLGGRNAHVTPGGEYSDDDSDFGEGGALGTDEELEGEYYDPDDSGMERLGTFLALVLVLFLVLAYAVCLSMSVCLYAMLMILSASFLT
jgi:hypothetical protein